MTRSGSQVRQLSALLLRVCPEKLGMRGYSNRRNGSRLVVRMMAKQCAWCQRPDTILDQILIYLGVRTTTHGMCSACATNWSTTQAVS